MNYGPGIGRRSGAAAYAATEIQTNPDKHSPFGLIKMLFEGALESIDRARDCFGDHKKTVKKVEYITKAVRIVDEGLKAALDPAMDQKTYANLFSLYVYISSSLTRASIDNDVAKLDSTKAILADLYDTWLELGKRVNQSEKA